MHCMRPAPAAARTRGAAAPSGRSSAATYGHQAAACRRPVAAVRAQRSQDSEDAPDTPAERGRTPFGNVVGLLLGRAASSIKYRGTCTCAKCRGSGECQCPGCQGKGVVKPGNVTENKNVMQQMVGLLGAVHPTPAPGGRQTNRCLQCRGTGLVVCVNCEGKGFRYKSSENDACEILPPLTNR